MMAEAMIPDHLLQMEDYIEGPKRPKSVDYVDLSSKPFWIWFTFSFSSSSGRDHDGTSWNCESKSIINIICLELHEVSDNIESIQ